MPWHVGNTSGMFNFAVGNKNLPPEAWDHMAIGGDQLNLNILISYSVLLFKQFYIVYVTFYGNIV